MFFVHCTATRTHSTHRKTMQEIPTSIFSFFTFSLALAASDAEKFHLHPSAIEFQMHMVGTEAPFPSHRWSLKAQNASMLPTASALEPKSMEKTMETTIIHWSNIRVIVGLYWDNGKENGTYYNNPHLELQGKLIAASILGPKQPLIALLGAIHRQDRFSTPAACTFHVYLSFLKRRLSSKRKNLTTILFYSFNPRSADPGPEKHHSFQILCPKPLYIPYASPMYPLYILYIAPTEPLSNTWSYGP